MSESPNPAAHWVPHTDAEETPAPPALRVPQAPQVPPASAAPSPAPLRPAAVKRPRRWGVTARGVVVLTFFATGLVGVLEVAAGGHRGHLFGIVFALSSGAGALVARRRDLPAAMIAPPLIYCVLIAAMSLLDTSGDTGSLSNRTAVYIATAFATGAPAIWVGTAAAAVIGWWRLRPRRN